MNFPQSWEIPDRIKTRFGKKTFGKQRAMVEEGHVLLVLHKAPVPGKREREVALFWRRPSGEWEATARGKGLRALRAHVEEYDAAEEKLTRESQEARLAADYFRILKAAAPLKGAASNLHAALQAAREAVHDDRDLIELRDEAGELKRNTELLYMDAKNALDFDIARKAEEQAQLGKQSVRTAHRLNILAAIFLPLATISSLFGMNLPHGISSDSPWVFWIVFAVGMTLGLIIRGWALKEPTVPGEDSWG
ncbi:MAG: hypothetical protein GY856_24845 [bacterium]|nr:hypothetical protein [bacterium]